MDYKYLSQPQKPLFSVARLLTYLLILVFNLWSFDTFAQLNYRVIACNDSDPENSIEIYLESINVLVPPKVIGDSFSYLNIDYKYHNYQKISSSTSYYYYSCPVTEVIVKPDVVETCDYGANINEMLPQISGNWTEGLFELSGVSYKYRIETETEIKYACDILHRYDVICHADNAAAVPEFDIAQIKDYPKHLNTVQLAYQGCLYDAILTSDVDNKWDGECYNATFLRTDNPSDQIGSVDFSPFACEEKICPAGQTLDAQGICQYESCPSGQFLQNGACVNNTNNTPYYISSIEPDNYWTGSMSRIYNEMYSTLPYSLTISQIYDFADSLMTTINGPNGCTNDVEAFSNYVRASWKTGCYGVLKIYFLPVEYKTCPDDSSIVSNQNCSTKICPNGSEIPFDYVCPTEPEPGTGTGTSGFFEGEYTKFTAYLDSDVNAAKVDLGPQFIGFYEVEYPNGFDDVLEKHQESFDNSALKAYTNKWTQSVNGNISLPSLYTMCFDMSPIYNLGCFEIPIDNRVWSFIRVILIFSSVVLARKITLGA